jgi:uncharacterized membrane protein
MATKLVIKNLIKSGWAAMKQNFTLFLQVLLILLAVNVIPQVFQDVPALGITLSILVILVGMILGLGLYRINLNIVDKKKTSLPDLWSQVNLFPDYLIGTVLYVLIVIGGLILLIVPGLVWAVKYRFYGYFIVDKRMKPMDAIRASGKATFGNKWRLVGLMLASLGINILGALALLVGLFATIPTTVLAEAYAYRQLSSGKAKK